MSGQEFLKSAIKEISSEFAGLLKASNEANEKRHSKTDAKLDKLIDTLTENTLELRDTRKDQEHIFKRMERLEQNQKEDGEKKQQLAESVLILNERMSKNNGRWDTVYDYIHKIATFAILTYLGYTM